MEPRAAAARELLLGALEDLSQEQLKRFRHKLRDERVDGRSIPWGRLERADTLDLVEQLVHFYGPERALDVAKKTLKRADVRDMAARLKERRLQSECQVGLHLGPPSASPAWAGSSGFPQRAPACPGARPLTLPSAPRPVLGTHRSSPFQVSAPAPRRCSPSPVGLSRRKAQAPSCPDTSGVLRVTRRFRTAGPGEERGEGVVRQRGKLRPEPAGEGNGPRSGTDTAPSTPVPLPSVRRPPTRRVQEEVPGARAAAAR